MKRPGFQKLMQDLSESRQPKTRGTRRLADRRWAGYRRRGKHDNVLVIDPREAEIIRGVYEMYAAGSEVHRIARKYGKSPQWIYHTLKNKIYLGKIPYAGKLHPGKHERIISPELYSSVLKKLETVSINDDSKRVVSRPKAYKYPYLLTGLLRCHCGRL